MGDGIGAVYRSGATSRAAARAAWILATVLLIACDEQTVPPGDAQIKDTGDPARDTSTDWSDHDVAPDRGAEAAVPDAAGDAPGSDAAVPDVALPDSAAPDVTPPPPPYPADKPGPLTVGHRLYSYYNSASKKWLETRVWYPAKKSGKAVSYFPFILVGKALDKAPLLKGAKPYPLVLFSHGNKGINYQSFTFTEYLASHGFVVAAPNHPGNTMIDNPNDQTVAQIALDRPGDLAVVLAELVKANAKAGHELQGAFDAANVGVAGHSFGGYTTLVAAGATVDVTAAAARCKAGTPADIFCPYIKFWTAGKTITRPAALTKLKAALALAPGGYAAFGKQGLKGVKMPIMLMGGSLDKMTTMKAEVSPIFADLGASPRYLVTITGAGHMSFTDICRIPGSWLIPGLKDFCTGKLIKIDRGFEIVNTLGTAFLRLYLKGEKGLAPYLSAKWAASKYKEAALASK